MNKIFQITITMAVALLTVTGCKSETASLGPDLTASPETSSPDNELFIFTGDQLFNKRYLKEENFDRLIGQYIKKKFPDITIKHVQWDNPGRQYQDLVAAGTIPDIILEDARRNTYRSIRKYDLQWDMTDLIKKYNFDTTKLNPAMMQQSMNTSDGKLYSLPFEGSDYLLFYNKDIFDKFGVDYPKPGMTYDEAYELAKKLTRQEGDITYKGYQQHPEYYMTYNQLSEPALNPNEDKASLVSDKWVRIVDNLRRFYDIPGNQFTTVKDFPKGHIAMAVDVEESIVDWSQNKDLNFDVSAVPVFPEASSFKYQPYSVGAFITKQSKKKELAFQVLAYLLSEEVQIERAKQGISSPLMTPAVQEAYGQGVQQLKGKSLQSLFALNNAMPAPRKPNLTFIDPKTSMVFPLIWNESKDSQTALRMINNAMDKAIEESKALQKEGTASPHL
ncbi:ABC transporter substrate-binding protein [Paenibacillus sp. GCM10023248]|uniref:ABC transporter substrate-binding protein n=1 Tax=Bacillales TaxID=1385 RepID=UPI002379CE94|nr:MULTISPECIES: extracellular solute-binding protein [Bacillales]MDD9268365.1 extracellular solute-binding protein [Paenibacillus sp. MAHUQ-63]MDR6879254.1 multiple sugar transport system substrate-binding protein [Bacillus sp. 3255]